MSSFLIGIDGTIILVPYLKVKSLCLTWRSGIRRWNLRDLQMSRSNLTISPGTGIVVPVKNHRNGDIILTKFSSLAQEVVKMTTFCAVSDKIFVKITFRFQRLVARWHTPPPSISEPLSPTISPTTSMYGVCTVPFCTSRYGDQNRLNVESGEKKSDLNFQNRGYEEENSYNQQNSPETFDYQPPSENASTAGLMENDNAAPY